MRILVVGAGAVGGYFGAHLVEAGRDVTFLVRERRAATFASHGLVVVRPDGTRLRIEQPPTTTRAGADFDLVLLAVKAFGLEQAMNDIAPAVGSNTVVVPLLNGLQHLPVLQERFGPDKVFGGLCRVATQLDVDGTIRQLGPGASMAYGELDGTLSRRAHAVDETLRDAGFDTTLSSDIVQDLWEKWFILASGGALTTLLRGTVGDIEAVPDGTATARTILAEFVAVARAAGHEPPPDQQAQAERTLTKPGSAFTTSTYRDLVAGNDVEADQLFGDLVRRAASFGLETPLFAAANAALEVHRARR